jgi:hypothetical protein
MTRIKKRRWEKERRMEEKGRNKEFYVIRYMDEDLGTIWGSCRDNWIIGYVRIQMEVLVLLVLAIPQAPLEWF